MEEVIKMKGSEILKKWNLAANVVANKCSKLGEIGDYIRSHGYDIHSDGFSCGVFSERGIDIWYNYNNFDGAWHLVPKINIGHQKFDVLIGERKNWPSIHYIDEDAIYDVPVELSLAEKFERGLIKQPEYFRVSHESGRSSLEHRYFKTFEEADKFAQKECQELIDRRFEPANRDVRWCYETSVRNDAQLAKEHRELRHYPWYDYQNHPHWIAVDVYYE